MTALLEARGLGVRAGPRPLFEGLDLALSPGEVLAIVGPSGSGKTTLLRTLALLIDPLSGEIALDGKSPDAIGITHFRRRVAYVAQRPIVLDGTVLDNLEFAFDFSAAATAFDDVTARATLEQFGVGADVLTQEARTLSEGQRQRIGLIRTLLTEPDVLLLDEPTSALDHDTAVAVETYLRALPCGIIVVTHDPLQVERLEARVLDLREVLGDG